MTEAASTFIKQAITDKKYIFILGAFFGLASAFLFEMLVPTGSITESKQIREQSIGYHFIKPLLACNFSKDQQVDQYHELNDQVGRIVKSAKKQNSAKNISVYFHELQSGRWVGIDEDRTYDPASLLKIALMLAYYRERDKQPDLFSHTYRYGIEQSMPKAGVPNYADTTLVSGQEYRVGDLIKAMIVDSDNGAKDLLLANVDTKVLERVHTDLGLPSPNEIKGRYVISPHEYSLFFRVLYNATYLNRNDSEEAMQMLSQTTYKDGLVAGVTHGITVAHKYGEFIDPNQNDEDSTELHDCGIVYGPKNPYFLCVMTSGKSVSSLSSIVKQISEAVYETTQQIQVD